MLKQNPEFSFALVGDFGAWVSPAASKTTKNQKLEDVPTQAPGGEQSRKKLLHWTVA